MGGAIGGLVGMISGDTELSGCVAIVDIELRGSHKSNSGEDHGISAPIRVGGLVGSTTKSVTYCYTGGTITNYSEADQAKYYIGRIVGGVGLEPLGVKEKVSGVSVSNSYSFMTLPGAGDPVAGRYNIGGTERTDGSTVGLSYNFYLGTGVSTSDEAETAVKNVTYLQLAGKDDITITGPGGDKKDIYVWLNGSDARTPFDEVTTKLESSGLSVKGRFSYVPQSAKYEKLRGLDYPFPTVLTQPVDPEKNGANDPKYHVHYGGWTMAGIERYKDAMYAQALGGSPVDLDIFTPEEGQKDAGKHVEYLKLSDEVDTDGKTVMWSVVSKDESVVTAELDDTTGGQKLTLKAVKTSDIPVTVTVTCEVGSETYTLDITVNVTADVSLTPGSLSMFEHDTVVVKLEPLNIGGDVKYKLEFVIDAAAGKNISSNFSKLEVSWSSDEHTITLRTYDEFTEKELTEPVWVDVPYRYTQGEGNDAVSVEKTHRIMVDLRKLPQGDWDTTGADWTWTVGFDAYQDVSMAEAAPSATWDTAVDISGNTVKVTAADNALPDSGAVLNVEKVAVTEPDGTVWQHTLAIPVPKPVTEKDLTLSVEKKVDTNNSVSWTVDFAPYTLESVTGDDAAVSFSGSTVTLTNVPADATEVTLTVTLTDGDGLNEKLNVTVVLPEVGDGPITPDGGKWTVSFDSYTPQDPVVTVLESAFAAEVGVVDGKSVVITLNELETEEDTPEGVAETAVETVSVTLEVTLVTEAGLRERCVLPLTLVLPKSGEQPEQTAAFDDDVPVDEADETVIAGLPSDPNDLEDPDWEDAALPPEWPPEPAAEPEDPDGEEHDEEGSDKEDPDGEYPEGEEERKPTGLKALARVTLDWIKLQYHV